MNLTKWYRSNRNVIKSSWYSDKESSLPSHSSEMCVLMKAATKQGSCLVCEHPGLMGRNTNVPPPKPPFLKMR